jgi:4'-phosphopantetheinyl transferase
MPSVHCDHMPDVVWDKEYRNQLILTSRVDVYRIAVTSNQSLSDYFNSILSTDEQERALRYHQQKDRQQFIIGRGLLRHLLGNYSNQHPDKIQLATGINKKPFLQNSSVDLHFNISHSGDWIMIAISDSAVGIDVEKIDEDFSYKEILQQNLSKKEIDFIQNGKQPAENFYLLWTRKEALLKATSKGISNDLCFIPSLDGEHTVDQKIIGSDESFCINSFKISENYIASIAYKTRLEQIRFCDINESSFQK